MKVILKQDLKDLGKAGTLVNVSDGYAKNYLIPRKLAVAADAAAMNELKAKAASEAHRLAVEKAQAEENAKILDGKTIRVSAHAGANGKLFGSITSKELAEKINETYNIEIEKKKITAEDIRAFGTYSFTVKLHAGIQASMFVVV